MSANDLMGRYADVQIAVDSLLQMSRQLRSRSVPTTDENLKLIEDGLFSVGHELLEITLDLKAEATAAEINNMLWIESLGRCAAMLLRYEQQAEENGLVPEILADRAARGAPAESFQNDRYDVRIDEAAGVVVVRERPAALPANVVRLPVGLDRAFYRAVREPATEGPGGAA